MTDGHTGFHVAPITEDDMFKVKDILQRAADAIVGMSQLSADVDMLRQTVSGLQADTERLRSQNNALDEALNYSRGERDRQATELSHVKAQISDAENVIYTQRNNIDKLELQAGQLQIDLDLTRKAKDDAEFHNLELEDKLKAAEAKLAKVAELHKVIFPATEPVPDLPPPTHPAPTPESEVAQPDTRSDWQPGYFWDHDTGKYWRQGLTPKPDGADIPY